MEESLTLLILKNEVKSGLTGLWRTVEPYRKFLGSIGSLVKVYVMST